MSWIYVKHECMKRKYKNMDNFFRYISSAINAAVGFSVLFLLRGQFKFWDMLCTTDIVFQKCTISKKSKSKIALSAQQQSVLLANIIYGIEFRTIFLLSQQVGNTPVHTIR